MKKKIVEKLIVEKSSYDFDGPLDELIKELNRIKYDNPEYKDIFLDVSTYVEYDSAVCHIEFFGKREETDEEYYYRVREEENQKEADKQKEIEYKEKIKKEAIRLGLFSAVAQRTKS